MTSSNGNMFPDTGFCAGNSPVTAGNSPVTGEFPSQRQWRGALMFSLIYAWTNGWVNNQDACDLRRHRAHYDVTVMWCRIVIQWSGQPRDLSAFNASLLSNFNWWNGSNWGVPSQSPPIICQAPTANRQRRWESYPTRWRPRLGENGKCWIWKFSLNDITQILLHIKDYNIWNSFSLTDMRLLPRK